MFPPENLSVKPSARSFLAGITLPDRFPIQGTKNLSADLITITRPLRPMLLRSDFTQTAPTVKDFHFFLAGVANLQLPSTYSVFATCQKLFSTIFDFLLAPTDSVSRRTLEIDYTNPEFAQVFLSLFLHFLLGPQNRARFVPGISPAKPGSERAFQRGSGGLIQSNIPPHQPSS